MRATVALLTMGLALAGCSNADDAQVVELVAGGGTQAATTAVDSSIEGELVDIVVANGILHVLTDDDGTLVLWTVTEKKRLTRASVRGIEPEQVSQVTAGPDGAIYASLWNGGGGVSLIGEDGRVQSVLGGGPDAEKGKTKDAADGATAAGARLADLRGVAVSSDQEIYFAEPRTDPVPHQLVRTVRGGRLVTVFGRDLRGLEEPEWRAARTSTGFPAGAKGTGVAAEGGDTIPLAVGPDGTLYAAPTAHNVIAVSKAGTTREVIGNTGGGAEDVLDVADDPWTDRGPASKAFVSLTGAAAVSDRGRNRSGLVTDRDGNLYLIAQVDDGDWSLWAGFDWTGDVTDSQREVLLRSKEGRDTTDENEVLQIRPDGTFVTASAHADAVAVDAGWLYLARAFKDGNGRPRVLVVRTAKQG